MRYSFLDWCPPEDITAIMDTIKGQTKGLQRVLYVMGEATGLSENAIGSPHYLLGFCSPFFFRFCWFTGCRGSLAAAWRRTSTDCGSWVSRQVLSSPGIQLSEGTARKERSFVLRGSRPFYLSVVCLLDAADSSRRKLDN